MKTVRFHPEAREEFEKAVEYYEEHSPGLGLDLIELVRSSIARLNRHPDAWPEVSKGIRRCQTNRIPFGVLYTVDDEIIFILAVMHLHRHPEYWKHRS